MGGKSKSTTQNTTITDASTVNLSQAGAEQAVYGNNNRISVVQTDEGSIESAFQFAKSANDANQNTITNAVKNSLGFGSDALSFGSDAFDFGGDVISGQNRNVADVLDFGGDVISGQNRNVADVLDFGGDVISSQSRNLETSFDFGSDTVSRVFNSISDFLNFGGDVISGQNRNVADVLDYSYGVSEGNLNFSSEALARSFEFGSGSVDNAFALSKSLTDSFIKQGNDTLMKAVNSANNNSEKAFQFATAIGRPDTLNTDNLKIVAIAAVISIAALSFAFKR